MIAGLSLCAIHHAAARNRHGPSDDTPGDFAYYVLSLSWSPTFCVGRPGNEECRGPQRAGFIVHGLWPQNDFDSPEHCANSRRVPPDVAIGMADLMPTRSLVFHEWSTHGSCTGLDPSDYFALLRQAYRKISIPQLLDHGRAVEESPFAVVAAFTSRNPSLPQQSVVATCTTDGSPMLREVRICMSRNLEPRPCSGKVLRGSCRSPAVLVTQSH